jgi:hypothetical protein
MFVAKIWLNCIMDDHRFNYMTNMIEKTLLMYAHVIGIFLLVIHSQNVMSKVKSVKKKFEILNSQN